jgi:hypothetical protein
MIDPECLTEAALVAQSLPGIVTLSLLPDGVFVHALRQNDTGLRAEMTLLVRYQHIADAPYNFLTAEIERAYRRLEALERSAP